jgi:hypothetical protein
MADKEKIQPKLVEKATRDESKTPDAPSDSRTETKVVKRRAMRRMSLRRM